MLAQCSEHSRASINVSSHFLRPRASYKIQAQAGSFAVVQSLSPVRLLWPHGLQHARLPCPSPSPGTHSNTCSSSWWRHPTISSSVAPFSSCLQSFPASGSLPISQLFASGGQSIGVSASASVLPMNIQGWFPLGLTGLTSLLSKGLLRVFSRTTVQRLSILGCSAFFMVQLLHPYMTTRKTIALTTWTFVSKVMSLLFNNSILKDRKSVV